MTQVVRRGPQLRLRLYRETMTMGAILEAETICIRDLDTMIMDAVLRALQEIALEDDKDRPCGSKFLPNKFLLQCSTRGPHPY